MNPMSLIAAIWLATMPLAVHAQVPGECTSPATEAKGKRGCFLNAAVDVGALASEAYWHIDLYPTLRKAKADVSSKSSVSVIFGKVYVQTVNDDPDWKPKGGAHVATIGPIPVSRPEILQTARFMQADTTPDMTEPGHVNSGPQAWYVIKGGQCVESSKGSSRLAAGTSDWIEAGSPMTISNGGVSERKALVLVLHPTDEPWMTMNDDWRSKGLCAKGTAP